MDGRDRLPYAPFEARDRHDRARQSSGYASPRIPGSPSIRVRKYALWVSDLSFFAFGKSSEPNAPAGRLPRTALQTSRRSSERPKIRPRAPPLPEGAPTPPPGEAEAVPVDREGQGSARPPLWRRILGGG